MLKAQYRLPWQAQTLHIWAVGDSFLSSNLTPFHFEAAFGSWKLASQTLLRGKFQRERAITEKTQDYLS